MPSCGPGTPVKTNTSRKNAEIATILFISPGTVKNHIAGIQNKLGTRNRVDIAAWAWESGIMIS
ncbi:response regulator transcription factor [Nonomuraea fuscirosea]|uniref:response regulator transcription factor n=1 Tax=Nonomuraea fuscirosea TaxID=1291556 RepID=UPI002DD8370C|nr:helix-turn-helix transcriptional regulator [Nonomuraea fuscirosea]